MDFLLFYLGLLTLKIPITEHLPRELVPLFSLHHPRAADSNTVCLCLSLSLCALSSSSNQLGGFAVFSHHLPGTGEPKLVPVPCLASAKWREGITSLVLLAPLLPPPPTTWFVFIVPCSFPKSCSPAQQTSGCRHPERCPILSQ